MFFPFKNIYISLDFSIIYSYKIPFSARTAHPRLCSAVQNVTENVWQSLACSFCVLFASLRIKWNFTCLFCTKALKTSLILRGKSIGKITFSKLLSSKLCVAASVLLCRDEWALHGDASIAAAAWCSNKAGGRAQGNTVITPHTITLSPRFSN